MIPPVLASQSGMAHLNKLPLVSSFLSTRAFVSGPNPAEPPGQYVENDLDQESPFCILLGRDG